VLVDAGILRKERQGQLRVCTLDMDRIREATGGWSPMAASPASVEAKPAKTPKTVKPKRAATKRPRAATSKR
jgi:hypothetical protein